MSCADGNETSTHPPAGCGTAFELHWKAVELIRQPASFLAAGKILLNFFESVAASIFPPGIPGKSKGRGQTLQASPIGER